MTRLEWDPCRLMKRQKWIRSHHTVDFNVQTFWHFWNIFCMFIFPFRILHISSLTFFHCSLSPLLLLGVVWLCFFTSRPTRLFMNTEKASDLKFEQQRRRKRENSFKSESDSKQPKQEAARIPGLRLGPLALTKVEMNEGRHISFNISVFSWSGSQPWERVSTRWDAPPRTADERIHRLGSVRYRLRSSQASRSWFDEVFLPGISCRSHGSWWLTWVSSSLVWQIFS